MREKKEREAARLKKEKQNQETRHTYYEITNNLDRGEEENDEEYDDDEEDDEEDEYDDEEDDDEEADDEEADEYEYDDEEDDEYKYDDEERSEDFGTDDVDYVPSGEGGESNSLDQITEKEEEDWWDDENPGMSAPTILFITALFLFLFLWKKRSGSQNPGRQGYRPLPSANKRN